MATNTANQTGPLTWVLGPSELNQLIEAMRTAAEVIMDLETTGLDEHATTGGTSNGGVAARIVLASFTLPQEGDNGRWDGETPITYILPLSHPDSPFLGTWRKTIRRVLLEGVVATRRVLNNQNVKFDARWTYVLGGVNLAPFIVWDPMVASHLLDETKSTRLKERVPIVFADEGVERWDDFDLTYPGAAEDVPLIPLGEYAGRDTWWNWRLSQYQKQQMFLSGGGYPEPIYDPEPPQSTEDYVTARLGQVATWIAMPTVASLTTMEQNGFRLDIPWAQARLKEEIARREGGLDKMAALFGQDRKTASSAATSNWFKAFTQRAVDEDKLRILSMTKNGNPQWNKGVLAKLARQGFETAAVVRDQRVGAKLAEYLGAWLGFVSADGRIHAQYNVGRMATGRLSSSNPNMQQVTKSLRPAFIPSDDCYIADFDFSQVELRVAAFVARCQPMIDAFNAGQDLHKILAQRIVEDRNRHDNDRAKDIAARVAQNKYVSSEELRWLNELYVEKPEKVALEDIDPKDRQGAKSANFGLLYLQSPEGYREYAEAVYGVVLTLQEAAQFHAAFFDQWKGMHEWHEETKRKVRRDGYIISPIGRVRRLPNIWDGNSWLREEAERQAVNSPVQGLASDLMQLAAADIQGLMPGTTAVPGVKLVATVHDSIVAELPKNGWQEAAAEVQSRMENSSRWLQKLGVDFDVPIVADYVVGTRWSLDDISNPPTDEPS